MQQRGVSRFPEGDVRGGCELGAWERGPNGAEMIDARHGLMDTSVCLAERGVQYRWEERGWKYFVEIFYPFLDAA